ELLEGGPGTFDFAILRCMVLAEMPGGHQRALDLQRQRAAADLRGWDLFNSQAMLRFLGQKREAVEASRACRRTPERLFPARLEQLRLALDYCCGDLSEERLAEGARKSRMTLGNAHFCVALTHLANGDRERARQHFRLVVETGAFPIL